MNEIRPPWAIAFTIKNVSVGEPALCMDCHQWGYNQTLAPSGTQAGKQEKPTPPPFPTPISYWLIQRNTGCSDSY